MLHFSLPLCVSSWRVRGPLAQLVCTTHNKHKQCFCSAILLRQIVAARMGLGQP